MTRPRMRQASLGFAETSFALVVQLPPMPEVVARYRGADGVEARVTRVSSCKFGVIVRDLDAEQDVPGVRYYPTQEQAEAYARKCAPDSRQVDWTAREPGSCMLCDDEGRNADGTACAVCNGGTH